MPKSIGFLRKYILIFLQNLKAISAVSIELSRKQKLTTYTHKYTHTHTHTRTLTYIHFRQKAFFHCRSYICKRKSKFDNWFLTPIQGFTQSNIQKAKFLRSELSAIYSKKTPHLKSSYLSFHRFVEGFIKAQIEGLDVRYLLIPV